MLFNSPIMHLVLENGNLERGDCQWGHIWTNRPDKDSISFKTTISVSSTAVYTSPNEFSICWISFKDILPGKILASQTLWTDMAKLCNLFFSWKIKLTFSKTSASIVEYHWIFWQEAKANKNINFCILFPATKTWWAKNAKKRIFVWFLLII